MPKFRRDKDDGSAAARRPSWRAGHLPRRPHTASDAEQDWISGWFHERLFESPPGEQAGGEARPETGPAPPPRLTSGWATGSPLHGRGNVPSDDLPDFDADCEDPPDRERL